MMNGGIGFFDSGAGGLTVLADCLKYLGGGAVYYYGDNARAPYGNLPRSVMKKYVLEAFDTFAALKASAAVVACNTVTALFIEELRKKYPFPIVGVEPAVFPAAKRGGDVFVLSTRATFESDRLLSLCARARAAYPAAKIACYPCDGLAGAVESLLRGEANDWRKYLPAGAPTAVVLGCTHYIYLKEEISRHYRCDALDGNEAVAKRLKFLLENRERQPLGKNFAFLKPLATTFLKKGANCRLFLQKNRKNLRRISPKHRKIKNALNLYFLGSGRILNLKIHERMFGFNKKIVEMVKNPNFF